MEVRDRATGRRGFSDQIEGPGAVVVGWREPDELAGVWISELDVLIDKDWLSLDRAFQDGLLITDSYGIRFRMPADQAELERGYFC